MRFPGDSSCRCDRKCATAHRSCRALSEESRCRIDGWQWQVKLLRSGRLIDTNAQNIAEADLAGLPAPRR